MTTITIRPARLDELPLAADVLAEAFAHDPVTASLLPPGDRRRRLSHLFHATLAAGAAPTGTVDLARDAEGRVLGAAAWEGPGATGSLTRYLRQLPRLLRAVGALGLPRLAAQAHRFAAARPRTPHWYLAQIGVSSRARGLGVGRRLLETHLAALDAMRQSAYLESSTPDNRRLYRRLGFVEIAPIAIGSAAPMGMLRPPASR